MEADDESCMEALASGDPDSARILVERYERLLFHYLLKLVRDPHTASDLFQEVFLVVCRRRRDYRAEGRFRSWLFAIATNLAMRELKRRRLGDVVGLPPDGAEVAAAPGLSWTATNPEHEVARRAFHAAVMEGLDLLPEEYRAALLLRDVLGFQYDEMARTLDVPVGTVRSRLARAREQPACRLRRNGFVPEVRPGGDGRGL